MTAAERVQAALDKKPPEWLWDQLASTRDVGDIAKELGVTSRALYKWKEADESRAQEWAFSLKLSGDQFAAEGKKILSDLEQERKQLGARRLESSHVALASERARTHMKIAAARHAEAWGERAPAPVIQLNVQSLHLEALKQFGSMQNAQATPHEIVQAEDVTVRRALPVPQNDTTEPEMALEITRTPDPVSDSPPEVQEAPRPWDPVPLSGPNGRSWPKDGRGLGDFIKPTPPDLLALIPKPEPKPEPEDPFDEFFDD